MNANTAPTGFTGYQKFIAGVLALLQFGVILDFMIMPPLGALIMPALAIGPRQFGLVVSAYAFAAGFSGLITAGFADRFDRRKLLLFFYSGFILGTFCCGLAASFPMLLAARIFTGVFGGVIGSTVLAIATDLFPLSMRGRVMGLIQTAFAASQVLGIPTALYLSNRWNWQAPFLALAALGTVGAAALIWGVRPIADHLKLRQERSPFAHLMHTVREPRHLLAFATAALLATGGFMLMPFASAYAVHNLRISIENLPTMYLITGLFTIFVGPLVGKAADKYGKFKLFLIGTALSAAMVLTYTHLRPVPLATLIVINTVLFIGIFSRMIPFQALVSAVPIETQRGSFNAIIASIQQLSGGVASVIAGHIVTLRADGELEHMATIGYLVVAASLMSTAMLWRLQRNLPPRVAASTSPALRSSAVHHRP